MARDVGLEQCVSEWLQSVPDLTRKPMFGGMAWLWHGHLLCGARADGLLLRLGKGQDGWALAMVGVTAMQSRGRTIQGWVRVAAEHCGDEVLCQALLQAALSYCRSLPAK